MRQDDGIVRYTLRPDEDLPQAARNAYFGFCDFWGRKFPPGTTIEHVGATAVTGCLTRGNVDICVIVRPENLEAVREALAASYEESADVEASDIFVSFTDPACDPPLDVHVVARDRDMDIFVAFRDALRNDPALISAYNSLKRAHAGKSLTDYRAAQDDFIARALAG